MFFIVNVLKPAALVNMTTVTSSQELEFWNVTAGNSSLRYTLYGRGVKPEFTVVPEDGVLNMGKAKLGKTTKKQIMVRAGVYFL